jgi:aquaporin Z
VRFEAQFAVAQAPAERAVRRGRDAACPAVAAARALPAVNEEQAAMSLFLGAHDIISAKPNKALESAENPNEMLDCAAKQQTDARAQDEIASMSARAGARLFAEALGTFFLVLVAAGGGMVNARFGGDAIPATAREVAPALMVMAVILSMGKVSGAHINPAVSVALALRGNFPWRRVPAYIAAQFVGSVLAVLLLRALVGKRGSAGLTLPGPGISVWVALAWEIVLTVGLVSVILATASGTQQIVPFAAVAVAGYIALAGLWGAPVSGASMNPARSLGPALVLGDWTAWWAYLAGPLAGAAIAAGCAWILRGRGGGAHGTEAAQAPGMPACQPVPVLPVAAPRHHSQGDPGLVARAGGPGQAGAAAGGSGDLEGPAVVFRAAAHAGQSAGPGGRAEAAAVVGDVEGDQPVL